MIKNYFKNFHTTYGILGIAAVSTVFVKMLLFYYFIGTVTNAAAALFVSCLLIYLFFASFKNKWIPLGIFAVFTLLMFCDVMYSSFFNRYLSFNMLAAAVFLGDITASIVEVFRAQYLLLFADIAVIIACLVKRHRAECGEEKKNTFLKPVVAVIVIAVLIANVTESNFIKSVSNQEIITYHIKDAIYKVFAITDGEGLTAFRDTYEEEKRGPLFGVAEGRNLIVVQLESFQNFVIGLEYNGQEVTPNLNRLLLDNTVYFDNYYQQIGSGNTSDAEFASNNSIYGSLMSYTYKLYGGQNYFRGLPVMLQEKGYETAVFHAYENKNFWSRQDAYPNLGFQKFYGGLTDRPGDGVYDMREWMGWGLTDTYFYEQTIELMDELEQPFYSYVISLSNHHPYIMLDHYQFIEYLPEDEGTIVGHYLNSAAYTDHALAQFFEALKEKGIYENSIIAIFGDHVGLTHSEEINASMEKLLARPYDFEDLMNIPLIITIPGADKDVRQTVSTAGGQLDFFPTIAYLMGFPQLDTLYLGHNLFAIDEGLVAEQTYMTKGSYFKNDIAFEMSRDGVFEHGRAWNIRTKESVPLSECFDDYVRAMEIINTSEFILKSDAIGRIFRDGEGLSEAFSADVSRTHPYAIATAAGVEDIDEQHQNDHRCIRIEMKWTEDSEPVGYEELIRWMERHADTLIVVNIERSGDYFMRFMSEQSPAAAERLIVEVSELYEYSGKHEAIINLTGLTQSVPDIREFVEMNNVWAILMTQSDAEGRFSSLLDLDTGIYIMGETDGFITKADPQDYKD